MGKPPENTRALSQSLPEGKRLAQIWYSMRGRCNSPTKSDYKIYGGRGIRICDEWNDSFLAFYEWSMANGYSSDLTIDRIDNNGNYEPSNCRWATVLEQNRNRRNTRNITAFGETKTIVEWADDERCAVRYRVLRARLDYGFDAEIAISIPVHGFKPGSREPYSSCRET